jgi:hypothetical protein
MYKETNMYKKLSLLNVALALMLAFAGCTQNSTLLSDAAAELQGTPASGSGSSSTSTSTSTTTAGGKLWVVGGTSGALSAALSTVLSYSVSENTWTTETTTGTYTPVSFAAYAKYGTKIYVFGGFNASGTAMNTTQIFDTATLTWSSGGNLPAAMAHGTAVVVGSKILVLGGTSVNAATAWAVSTMNALYDPSTDTATAQTALGATTGQGSDKCAVADGTAVIHSTSRTAAATITAATQPFFLHAGVSPATPTTTTLGTTFTNRSGVACVLYSPGTTGNINFILAIGGLTANTGNTGGFVAGANNSAGGAGTLTAWASVATVQNLGAPYTGAWGTNLPLPVATSFAGAAILNNVLYVVGGNTGTAATQNIQATTSVYAASLSPNGTNAPLLAWSANVPGSSTALAVLPTARWGHGLIAMP